MTNKKLYTAPEAAKELHVSLVTFYRWLHDGRFPAFKVGFGKRRNWRIEYDVIQGLKEKNSNGYQP